MAVTPFRVVAGKHIAFKNSARSGVVSAFVDGGTFDVSSSFWPFLFDFVVPDLEFTAVLKLNHHPVYGARYQVQSKLYLTDTHARYKIHVDAIQNNVSAYLMKRLKVLVKKFGRNVFDKIGGVYSGSVSIEDLLVSKRGTPPVREGDVRKLADALHKTNVMLNLAEPFPPIDMKMALKYAGILTAEDIRVNPYNLFWRKPHGLAGSEALHVADAIAENFLGGSVAPNDNRRLAAYFEAAVKRLQQGLNHEYNGSVWFQRGIILSTMLTLQSKDDDSWHFDENMLNDMFDTEYVFLARNDDGLFARPLDDSVERTLADDLVTLQRHGDVGTNTEALDCLSLFDDMTTNDPSDAILEELDRKYVGWKSVYDSYVECDERQRSTLRIMVEKRVLILTGGAGTGKSKTIGLIVRFSRVILKVNMKAGALTGKAVDRLKQLFHEHENIECRTLHSMAYDRDPIHALVVDESSMASPALLRNVIKDNIIEENMSYLVICGDDKQLPSIEAGAFLRDIISSDAFSNVRLEKIYRAGEGSGIATEAPKIFGTGTDQLRAAPMDTNGFKIVLEFTLEDAIRAFKHVNDAPENVVMISNLRRTCNDVNRHLQPICNPRASDPRTKQLKRSEDHAPWVVGDRVISFDNVDIKDEDGGRIVGRIFNGMIGYIHDIDLEKKTFLVRFRDNLEYQYEEKSSSVDHAYCVTTWKFQGSEKEHVIVYFEGRWGLSCELLYTSVTRGQRSTTTYLSAQDLDYALKTRIGPIRVTGLAERIKAANRKRIREEYEDENEDEDGNDTLCCSSCSRTA